MKPVTLSIVILLLFSIVFSIGCVRFAKQAVTEDLASDPLAGSWDMVRVSISPALPIPNIITNQIISEKAAWKIARQSGKLIIKYDGKDTWYKVPGLTPSLSATTVNENTTSGIFTFSQTGTIAIDGLPMLLSAITNRKTEQISAQIQDEVKITIKSANSISAVINAVLSGKYYGETEIPGTMRWKTIDARYVITYDGTRR